MTSVWPCITKEAANSSYCCTAITFTCSYAMSQPNSRSACHEIATILWNPKVRCLTTARHCALSRTRLHQFRSSNSITLRSNLILFSHLHPCLLSVFFSSGFHTKILYKFIFSPMHATFSAHLVLFRSLP